MTTVLTIVAPVFALIALGYAAARWKRISEEGFRGINDFVFWLATPALMFGGGITREGSAAGVVLVFFGAALPLFALAVALGLRLLRLPLAEASLFALSATFGNTVMLGIPVMVAAYGQSGLSLMLGIVALHSILLLPLATVLVEIGRAGRARLLWVVRASAEAILRNPIILSVLAALMVVWLGIPVPEAVVRLCGLLGAAAPPAALFCLGASLAGFGRVGGAWREVTLALLLKMLLLPALVWAGAAAAGLGPLETAVAVTAAALPTGANPFILARRYRLGDARSGATVLAGTLASVVVLGVLLVHFRAALGAG
ncbi:MAG: AEC family transporter [Acetobacteraceae bacterium]|nr:AEC family transporter [Acetobacteraceae bacterium]